MGKKNKNSFKPRNQKQERIKMRSEKRRRYLKDRKRDKAEIDFMIKYWFEDYEECNIFCY